MLETQRTRELPGGLTFRVTEHFTKLSNSEWENICLKSFELMKNDLKALIIRLCKKHFEEFDSSGLLGDVRLGPLVIFLTLVERLLSKDWTLQLEKHGSQLRHIARWKRIVHGLKISSTSNTKTQTISMDF